MESTTNGPARVPKGIPARCLKRQLARTVYTTLKNEPPVT